MTRMSRKVPSHIYEWTRNKTKSNEWSNKGKKFKFNNSTKDKNKEREKKKENGNSWSLIVKILLLFAKLFRNQKLQNSILHLLAQNENFQVGATLFTSVLFKRLFLHYDDLNTFSQHEVGITVTKTIKEFLL